MSCTCSVQDKFCGDGVWSHGAALNSGEEVRQRDSGLLHVEVGSSGLRPTLPVSFFLLLDYLGYIYV